MKDKALQFVHGAASGKAGFCLGLGIILLLAFIPSFAQAAWWNPLSWGGEIKDALIGVIVTTITFVPALIFFVVAGLTSWMIDIVVSISVVPGAETTPEFVEIGWQLTRNLVNAVFILILVFIGLATILRIQNYQLQRTLPMLIIIALLVNFSGVFVGLIVDMANIVSNFFLNATGQFGSQTFANIFTVAQIQLEGMDFAQKISYAFIIALFYLVSSLVFFIVFLLFFLRTIILWLLVILAPIAFASYILPATKKYWTQWFEQLIQWSIIGIPIGFFLYLSNIVLHSSSNLLGAAPALAGEASYLSGLISSILAPIVGLVLLFVGVMLSMQMAPAGAKGVINFGTTTGRRAGLAAGSAAWRFRGAGPVKLEKGIGQSLRGFGEKLAIRGTRVSPGTREKTIKAIDDQLGAKLQEQRNIAGNLSDEAIARRRDLPGEIEKLEAQKKNLPLEQSTGVRGRTGTPVRFLARWAGRGISAGAGEIEARVEAKDEAETAQGEAEGTGKNSKTNATKINQELMKGQFANSNRVIGLLRAIVKNGDSDDLQQYMREGLLSTKLVGKAMMDAQRGGPPSFRPLFKANYGRLLSDPESFGFGVEHEKDADGKDVIKRDALGAPIFTDAFVRHSVQEVPEKLSAADITNKILGDTIDSGKAGGTEFHQFGGEIVIKHLLSQRGGDLVGQLMRRPESIEGRTSMSTVINDMIRDNQGEFDKTTLQSLYRYFTSSGARSAGLGLDIIEDEGEGRAKMSLDEFLEEYLRTQGAAPRSAQQPSGGSTASGPPGYIWNGRMWVPPSPRGRRRAGDTPSPDSSTEEKPPRGRRRAE